MPLEACPLCGYALSTETGRCRHCASERALSSVRFNWMNAIAFAVAIGCVVYVLFFR